MHILLVYVDVIHHFFLREVRKSCAVGRTDGIDGTHVGLAVEELAGLAAVHPLPFPVLIQPLLAKLRDGHAEMRRDPFQVLESEGRRHVPATVAAGQAVHFIPYFFLYLHGQRIQKLRRVVFQFGQEPAESRAVLQHILIKLPSVVRHNKLPEIKGFVAMFEESLFRMLIC